MRGNVNTCRDFPFHLLFLCRKIIYAALVALAVIIDAQVRRMKKA